MLGPYGTDFSVKSRFRHFCLSSCRSMVPVPVPRFRFLLLDTRFSGVIGISLSLLLVWLHFGTILVQNQAKPKVLVFEPKLTGTLTAQNCRYQSTKVSVHSVFPVLAQHYYLKFQLYLYHDLHFEHKFLTEPISLAKYYSSDVRVLQYLC